MTIKSFVAGYFNRILLRYRQHERLVGWLFFLAGILWDALTLRRIDNFLDNFLLLSYLFLLTFVVVSDILMRAGRFHGEWSDKIAPWIPIITQFLLGAILSAIVIFYARSIAWASHIGFWLLLVLSLLANEFLHRRLSSLTMQVLMLFGCSTFIFAWLYPVLAGHMSPWLFRLACLSGLMLSLGVVWLAYRLNQITIQWWGNAQFWSLGLFLVWLNVGYEKNWIPPVPLSVTAGGVYQRAEKVGETYTLAYLTTREIVLFPSYAKKLYYRPGETVYCFTSIFAPTSMKERVFHVWERFNPATGAWNATDRIGYNLSGGRDTGYRGLTQKRNVSMGRWRVVVETERGKVLSRMPFEVVPYPDDEVRWIDLEK